MNPVTELVVKPASFATRPWTSPSLYKELTIKDIWSIVVRRKFIVAGTVLLFVGICVALCVSTTRLYKGTTEVQVQKETSDALALNNMMGSSEGESDALDATIILQTQARILQSDSLALQVIKDLGLEKNEDFRPKFSLVGWALGRLSKPAPEDANNVAIEDDPVRRTRALKVFQDHLKVEPVSGTRLVNVSYLNSDPKVASEVANALVQGLVDYNFQTRHTATHEAVGWLGNQLSDLRQRSEELQAKVVRLQRDSGVFTLGQTDMQGREQVYTPILDRLQQATTQLTQAQSARIMKGALYQAVKDGDPELISGLTGTGMLGSASPGISGSLSLIQNLRAQEATTQAQLNQLSAKFGPGYPPLAQVAASLESTQKAIQAEVSRVAGRAKNDYEISQQVENSARSVFQDGKRQADALNSKAVEYEITRQEAVQSRNLYESLLGRLKEADLVAGLRSTNITLVDRARPPSRPVKPNVPVYLAVSLAGGLIIGLCGALFRDATDSTIQDLPELEAFFGGTPLGVLPYFEEPRGRLALPGKGNDWAYLRELASNLAVLTADPGSANSFAAITAPRAPFTEAVRILRTSLMNSTNGPPPKIILITSSLSGEGKSMLSANLAILFAQQGKKVLLVDGDLRTPVLHHRLRLKNDTGLSTILATDANPESALSAAFPMTGMPGLYVMAAGPEPPCPAELLGSDQMGEVMHAWRREYDFVIVDGAPVLPVTDSVLLSTHADLTLVVARYQKTDRKALERTCSVLQSQGAHNLGVVVNAVRPSTSNTYGYYYDN
jgi:succinoglycan biosynthesis transport protein ExoP